MAGGVGRTDGTQRLQRRKPVLHSAGTLDFKKQTAETQGAEGVAPDHQSIRCRHYDASPRFAAEPFDPLRRSRFNLRRTASPVIIAEFEVADDLALRR